MFNIKAIGQKITKNIRKTMDVIDSKLFAPQNPDIPTSRQKFFVWRIRTKIHARVWFHTRYTITKIRVSDRLTKLFPPKPIKIQSETAISHKSKPTFKLPQINVRNAVKRIKSILWANLEPIYTFLLFCGIQFLILNDKFWQTVWNKWATINYRADVWYEQSNIKLKQRFIHGSSLMKLAIGESFKYILSKLYYVKKSILNIIYALVQDVKAPNAIRGFYNNLEEYKQIHFKRQVSFKRGARIFGVWWIIALLMIQSSIAGVFYIATLPPKQQTPWVDNPTLGYNGYLYGVSILNTTQTENGTWLNISSNAIQTIAGASLCDYQVSVYDVKTGFKVDSTPIINQTGNKNSTIYVGSGGGVRQFKVSLEPVIYTPINNINAYIGVIINAGPQPPTTNGVAKYWVGGTGTWSDTAHWSLSSGGASGAAKPVATDWVIVDAGSDSAGANFWINLNENSASLLTFSMNDPDCLATFNGSWGTTFTVTGAVTITADTFNAYGSTLVISSGVTTAYGLTIAADGVFNGGNGTHKIGRAHV